MIVAAVTCWLMLGCSQTANDPWCVREPIASNSGVGAPRLYGWQICGNDKTLCYPRSPNGAICYTEKWR